MRREGDALIRSRDRYRWLKSMYKLNGRMSWLHRVQGIDISRCFEYTRAYETMASIQGKQILDIGSYRSPLPIFLAHQGYQVSVADLNLAVRQQQRWVQRALGRNETLFVSVADGTRLPFVDSTFDGVTCISTIEHLPGDGDHRMVCEMARVLRPGGHCFISVPYASVLKEGVWGRWFQRWYGVPAASSRLVKPSGLTLVEQGFMLGGRIAKVADFWYRLPRYLRHTLSWSHVFFFPKAFELDVASQCDARVLWLFLQKP